MIDETIRFTTAIDFAEHPMNDAKTSLKKQYYLALEYFVKASGSDKYVISRLEQYKRRFYCNKKITNSEVKIKKIIYALNSRKQHWRKQHRYWLMCDIALILMDDHLIDQTSKEMQKYMTTRQWKMFDILLEALKSGNKINFNSKIKQK